MEGWTIHTRKIALEEPFGLPERPQYYAVGQCGLGGHDGNFLGVSVTDSNRRVRPVPTVVWQGSTGNRRPNADQITMAPTINRSSQPREPSTARAVSVPLALHCMELAALEAICRKLTT
jgi:hypothetical protein